MGGLKWFKGVIIPGAISSPLLPWASQTYACFPNNIFTAAVHILSKSPEDDPLTLHLVAGEGCNSYTGGLAEIDSFNRVNLYDLGGGQSCATMRPKVPKVPMINIVPCQYLHY